MRNPEFYNEADVRAEIIDPLLKDLGYAALTDNHIRREETLRYPKAFLGRKGPNDKEIIGRADYICEVRGATRWVIEAKAQNEEINEESDWQSYSYANHPSVRAVYYAICNGNEFLLYRTNAGPCSDPLLKINASEIPQFMDEIRRFLSPESLRRLASILSLEEREQENILPRGFRLLGGEAEFLESECHLKNVGSDPMAFAAIKSVAEPFMRSKAALLKNTIYPLRGGELEFLEDGRLRLEVVLGAASRADDELQKNIGIDTISFEGSASKISEDKEEPTILESVKTVTAPSNQLFEHPVQQELRPLGFNLDIEVLVEALVYMEAGKIKGKFYYSMIAIKDGIEYQAGQMGNFEMNCV